MSRTWLASPSAKRFHPPAIETLQREFGLAEGGSGRFVVKDPRICRLVPFWGAVARKAGIRPLWIHTHREPTAVAASLQHRNGMEPEYAHLLWLRHVLDAEAGTRGQARFFTSYSRLMRDWASVRDRSAAALGLEWEPLTEAAAAEIDGFLDFNRASFLQQPEAVPDGGRFSDWLRETFGVLERWSDAGRRRPTTRCSIASAARSMPSPRTPSPSGTPRPRPRAPAGGSIRRRCRTTGRKSAGCAGKCAG